MPGSERAGNSAFRHIDKDRTTCPLSGTKQVRHNDAITLACIDCDGLLEMPCPYCDYVRVPNKSGFGMAIHVYQEHPEHVTTVKTEGLVIPDA